MQKSQKPPISVPGSFQQFAATNLRNSERNPERGCVGNGGAGDGRVGMEMVTSASGQGLRISPQLISQAGAVRVNLAGNFIHTLITPKNVTPLERVFRRNAVEGILQATPTKPFRFELGSLVVPSSMSMVLLDFRFAVYVPTAIPGDAVELEDRRLSTSMGFDMKFSEKRPDNLQYQLEPSNPSPFTDEFAPSSNAGIIPGNGIGGVSDATFAQLRSAQFASVAGPALSTLPQRRRRESQLDMPFTYIVNAAQRITAEAVIFRPIPYPIAFFEAEMVGMLVGANVIEEFAKGIVASSNM